MAADAASTTVIRVTVPPGFRHAKPMPKPGWTVSVKSALLDKPFEERGKPVLEDVSKISWSAASRDAWLPDAYYDEFVLYGSLPQQAGAMWFKVLQTCDKGSTDWAQVPGSGMSTQGITSAAALLEIIPSDRVGGRPHGSVLVPDSGDNRMNRLKSASLLFGMALAWGIVHAQNVEVKDAWVRTSVQGQKSTGAFMKITAKENMKLVSASSPVASIAEVHEMKMEGDVMKMRAVKGSLDLPAGKTVELSPGGYHLMMMDLKAALPKDSTVPLTLVFKDAKGVESKVELKVPVGLSADAGKHKR